MRFALLFLVACNSSSSTVDIRASNYDQSCTQASDCMVISEGSCCPQCAFAAINKNASSAYQADEKKRQEACAGAKCALPPCAPAQLVCNAGKCGFCVGVCTDSGVTGDAATDAPNE
jgi:hypothetical protein